MCVYVYISKQKMNAMRLPAHSKKMKNAIDYVQSEEELIKE